MKNIDIRYPVSHFDDAIIMIPDKYTLRHIIGNIISMNGPVIFDDMKFSATNYQSKKDEKLIRKIRIKVEKKVDDQWLIVYQSYDESLEDLEMLIYQMMKYIEKFPDRDVRYDVTVLGIDEE